MLIEKISFLLQSIDVHTQLEWNFFYIDCYAMASYGDEDDTVLTFNFLLVYAVKICKSSIFLLFIQLIESMC